MSVDSAPVTPAPVVSPTRSILREHLGLFIAAVPLIVLVLRVILVSKGDGAVLSALVRYSDTKILLTMSLVALVPTVVLVGAISAIVSEGFRSIPTPLPEQERRFLMWSVTLLTFYYLASIEWPIALAFAGLLMAVFLFRRFQLRRNRKAGVKQSVGFDATALIATFFSVMAISSIWFPLEHIVFNNGTSRVGYVLNTDDPMVVLWKVGSVQYVMKADVKTRQLCDSAPSTPSLFGWNAQRTPACPKTK